MLHNSALRTTVVLIVVALCPVVALGHSISRRQTLTSDEQQIRELIGRYFESFSKRQIGELVSLWSGNERELASKKEEWQKLFSSNDKIEIKNVDFGRIAVRDDKGTVIVAVEISALNTRTNSPSTDFGKMNRSFQCVKHANVWAIARESGAEKELASSLAAAGTDRERALILNDNRNLINRALIRALIGEGNILKGQGKFAQAEMVFILAQTEAESIADRPGIALALRGSASTKRSQGDYEASLVDCNKSLTIEEADKNETGIAASLNAIASVEFVRGEYANALKAFEQSLAISEQLKNTEGAANVLNNIGMVYYEQGNYLNSLASYEKSLANTPTDDKFGIASTLLNIGNLYIAIGNYPLAQDYLERAMARADELGSKAIGWKVANNLGLLQRNEGNLAVALRYYESAIAIATSLDSKDRLNSTYSEIGAVYYLQGDYPHALESFKKSLELAQAIGVQSPSTLNSIALMQNSMNQPAAALAYAERAVGAAREMDQNDALWQTLTTRGQIFAALGDPTKAKANFDEAIHVIEGLRNEIPGGETGREEFFENKLGPYTSMVDVLVAQNKLAEALEYAERAKGRVLLDVLRDGRTGISKAMTDEEKRNEQELSRRLVALNIQLMRERGREAADSGRVSDLQARLNRARLDREDFQNALFANHSDLKIQRGDIEPLSAEQTRILLPDENLALLEYVFTDKNVYLFVLSRSAPTPDIDIRCFKLAASANEISELVEKFRQRLANRDLDFSDQATRLYSLLIKPAQEILRKKTSLVIVPDAQLWDLPFQALQPSADRFLIESSAISYVPSLSVLREITSRQRKPTAGAQMKLMAIGNPDPGEQTVKRAHTVLGNEELGALPEAEKQVKALGQMYGVAQSRIYVRAEALEERVKTEAGNFKILQFATHGVLNNANPMYSHVVLSQSKGNANEDGLLEAWEIMNLDLNADLVVLSACDTARGRIGAGEGVIGLSWAFFVAGSPTTVVTQWSVESASTTDLMLAFHQNLQSSGKPGSRTRTKAESLRQAEISILKNPRYRHPFYWAGIVLVGNGS